MPETDLTHEAIDRALDARLEEIKRVVPAERRREAVVEAFRQADALRALLRKRSGQGAAPHRCEPISGPGWTGYRCY